MSSGQRRLSSSSMRTSKVQQTGMFKVQQAGMFKVHGTMGMVLCCKCGVSMRPNPANMCVNCLRSETDITEGLQRNVVIMHCPDCSSYLQPPKTWIKALWESKELLSFCIKRVKNLSKMVRLVNAEFVWTEPHSKRIKVKLTVQKEVLHGAILEQSFVVEFTVRDNLCDSCSRTQANPDQWVASVQLRQRVPHRRTFFYLEQLILKHDAVSRAVRIIQMNQGIDFFFGSKSHASHFVKFIGQFVPIDYRDDKSLVSHDLKSNNYNYKYTFSVEICPICREDLVCLHPSVSRSMGNLGPLVVCAKVTDRITLLDPFTLRYVRLDAEKYWRYGFKSALTSRELVKFRVLNVEPIGSAVNAGKHALYDVEVVLESDFGRVIHTRTRLGRILKPGDQALGYNLLGANVNDSELENYGMNGEIPDVILIKKSYDEELRELEPKKSCHLNLNSLQMEIDESITRAEREKMKTDYEEFAKELEKLSLSGNKNGEDVRPIEDIFAGLDLEDIEE